MNIMTRDINNVIELKEILDIIKVIQERNTEKTQSREVSQLTKTNRGRRRWGSNQGQAGELNDGSVLIEPVDNQFPISDKVLHM